MAKLQEFDTEFQRLERTQASMPRILQLLYPDIHDRHQHIKAILGRGHTPVIARDTSQALPINVAPHAFTLVAIYDNQVHALQDMPPGSYAVLPPHHPTTGIGYLARGWPTISIHGIFP